jgi:hypothetical protein
MENLKEGPGKKSGDDIDRAITEVCDTADPEGKVESKSHQGKDGTVDKAIDEHISVLMDGSKKIYFPEQEFGG